MSDAVSVCPMVSDLEMPEAPELWCRDKAVPNRSPCAIAGLDLDIRSPVRPPPILISKYAEGEKVNKVSPTTKFLESNPFRSKSPTDHSRSPKFLLKRQYLKHYLDKERQGNSVDGSDN
jgi:hypothetical protein